MRRARRLGLAFDPFVINRLKIWLAIKVHSTPATKNDNSGADVEKEPETKGPSGATAIDDETAVAPS
jgi:hypothetical protein